MMAARVTLPPSTPVAVPTRRYDFACRDVNGALIPSPFKNGSRRRMCRHCVALRQAGKCWLGHAEQKLVALGLAEARPRRFKRESNWPKYDAEREAHRVACPNPSGSRDCKGTHLPEAQLCRVCAAIKREQKRKARREG